MYKLLNEHGMWQELQHNKYLRQKTLAQIQVKPSDSSFWKGIMGFKMSFFRKARLWLVMGVTHIFGKTRLLSQFSSLDNLVCHKNVIVADVLTNTPPQSVKFRRS